MSKISDLLERSKEYLALCERMGANGTVASGLLREFCDETEKFNPRRYNSVGSVQGSQVSWTEFAAWLPSGTPLYALPPDVTPKGWHVEFPNADYNNVVLTAPDGTQDILYEEEVANQFIRAIYLKPKI